MAASLASRRAAVSLLERIEAKSAAKRFETNVPAFRNGSSRDSSGSTGILRAIC
jgi:hypothetical protein